MTYLELASGIIYLLMGGDLLVRGSVALARRAAVSEMVVALTVVALGTSLPELVIAVDAAIAGYPGIVLGNVVGSNIANVLLVGGLAALVYPLTTAEKTLGRDGLIMTAGSLLFGAACLTGQVGRLWGLVLFGAVVAASVPTVRDAARAQREAEATPLEWVLGLPSQRRFIALFIVLGLIGLPLGASMVVDSAVTLAAELGISDALVGLTIVAVSTSLPELATAVVAAWHKRSEVIMGTILGSNVFNVLGIMGTAALVSPTPIRIPATFLTLDVPVMIVAAITISVFAWTGRPVGRAFGILFTVAYGIYLAAVAVRL